jgi:hypothetical protein
MCIFHIYLEMLIYRQDFTGAVAEAASHLEREIRYSWDTCHATSLIYQTTLDVSVYVSLC